MLISNNISQEYDKSYRSDINHNDIIFRWKSSSTSVDSIIVNSLTIYEDAMLNGYKLASSMNAFKTKYSIDRSGSGFGGSERGIFNSVDKDFDMCSLKIKINIGRRVASGKIRLNVSFPDSLILMNERYYFNTFSLSEKDDNSLGHYPFSMIQYIKDELLISWESDHRDGTLTIDSIDIGDYCFNDRHLDRSAKVVKYYPVDENVVKQREPKLFIARDMPVTTTLTPVSHHDNDDNDNRLEPTPPVSKGNENDQGEPTPLHSIGMSLFPNIIILSLLNVLFLIKYQI